MSLPRPAWLVLALLLLPQGVAAAPDLVERLTAAPVLRGAFRQENLLAEQAPVKVATGQFVLARGAGLYWQIDTPVAAAWLVEQRKAKVVAGDIPPMSNRMARLVMDLVQLRLLTDDRFSRQIEGDANAWSAHLQPLQPAAQRRLISIVLEGGEFLEQVEISFVGGSQMRLQFLDVTSSTRLSDGECRRFKHCREAH